MNSVRRTICRCLATGAVMLAGVSMAGSEGVPSLVPPQPPPVKSPVDLFRDLLALPPQARKLALTNKPPVIQQQILEKVKEYEALSGNERELRLQVTALHWYLWPLMNTPPTNRVQELTHIPEDYRELVSGRLQFWDSLSPAVQQELRENEPTMRHFAEMREATQEQQQRLNQSLTPARREQLQRAIAQWRALPDAQRTRALSHFNRFFTLSEQEKQRALSTLSEPERKKMESTLRSFAHLSPGERARCLAALDKYARLTTEERQEFLINAERWKAMPPDQREAWSQLVNSLASRPPMPTLMPPIPRPPPVRPLVINSN